MKGQVLGHTVSLSGHSTLMGTNGKEERAVSPISASHLAAKLSITLHGEKNIVSLKLGSKIKITSVVDVPSRVSLVTQYSPDAGNITRTRIILKQRSRSCIPHSESIFKSII